MPTYDIIGTASGSARAAGAPLVGPGPVVAGTAYGVSRAVSFGRVADSTIRGRMDAYSSARSVLIWTRSIGGTAAGASRAISSAFTKTITITSIARSVGTMTGRVGYAHNGLLLADVARAVYALWGYEGIQNLSTISVGRERIAEWCNAAMQLIYAQSARLEYFNRSELTLLVGTSGSVALPATVQRIQGDARLAAGRSLKPLSSRSQVTDFATLYGSSAPIGFLVDSQREESVDSLGLTLYLAPAPSDDVEVTVDVTLEPPRWNSSDLLSGLVIPLPHKWVETLFMPLVRKWAAGDSRMPKSARASQMQEIDAQYSTAREILGLADIQPTQVIDSKEGLPKQ